MDKLFTVFLLVVGSVSARCPIGTIQGLNPADCYKLVSFADTWYGAEERCQRQGGHLSSVNSAFANAFIRDQALWSDTDFWLGGSEGSSFGSWTWSDGRRFSYTNWDAGQPTRQSALCLSIATQTGLWYSQPCFQLKPYVCKVASLFDNAGSAPTQSPLSPRPTQSCTPCECPTCAPSTTCEPDAEPTWETPYPFPRCSFGWTYNNVTDNCLKVYSPNPGAQMSWPNANSSCVQNNATLMSIHSPEENVAITDFLFEQMTNHDPVAVIWIGLHAPHGRWVWSDGTAYDYANWAQTGETHCSSDADDCTVAIYPSDGTWTGYDNGTGPWGTQPYLCKKPANY